MDYIDLVYVAIKDLPPGKHLMSNLKDSDKFISAVKYLIDGGWITNVHWDKCFYTMTIEEKFPFHSSKKPVKTTWYNKLLDELQN